MNKVIVVIVSVLFIVLGIQWLPIGGIAPQLETVPTDDLSMQVDTHRDDKAGDASTTYSVNPLPQQTVTEQTGVAKIIQDIGPILDADVFVEDTSEVEPVNVGKIIDADTDTEPSVVYGEPRDVGEQLDADSEFAEQLEYTENKNTGPNIDVDNDYLLVSEHLPQQDIGPDMNADDDYADQ
jgi:hypothetical protein